MLNIPVNNVSVMLGRSHRFLGITVRFFFLFFFLGGGVNMSCARTQHADPSGCLSLRKLIDDDKYFSSLYF